MGTNNSPVHDDDKCWRCDERSIAIDEKRRPLCARHAMIFLSAPRLIEARKRAEADAEGQESAIDEVNSHSDSPHGSDMASRVTSHPSPIGEEVMEVLDRRRKSIEISLSLYRTHPDQTKQFLEQRSGGQLGDGDLSARTTPYDTATSPAVVPDGSSGDRLETDNPVLSPSDDVSGADDPQEPMVESVAPVTSFDGGRVDTPTQVVPSSQNGDTDTSSDRGDLNRERPPVWKVQRLDEQVSRPASATVCSYSNRPLPSSARRLIGRAD